ncbi:hypothetical protein AHAS_Ahas10G0070100 [Arachis hypogaea]
MRRMIVEMDFKGVDFITKREEDEERYCYNPFLQEIRRIKNKHWELQFRHIRREANRVANAFAKFALSKAKGFPFFDNPPENLEQILYDNVKGMYTYPIYCLVNSFFFWGFGSDYQPKKKEFILLYEYTILFHNK